MTSSPNNHEPSRDLTPYEIGVVLGLASGLMAHSLYTTKSGRDFSSWLKKHVAILSEELDEVRATNRSKTYQELSQLITELKQSPHSLSAPTPKTATPWLKQLQTHLFANSPTSPATLPTKKSISSPQFFHQTSTRRPRRKS